MKYINKNIELFIIIILYIIYISNEYSIYIDILTYSY